MGLIKDINNYFYLLKIVKREEKGVDWSRFKLRRDYIGRIYTVISLNEDFISQVSSFEITQEILDQMKPINNYLTVLDLQEIIAPSVRRIDGTNSWLVVYSPLMRSVSWKNFIITSSIIAILYTSISFRSEIVHLFSSLKTEVTNLLT